MVYYGTTLTLFATEIDPRRNLFIDEIGQYLDSITAKVTFQDFRRFTPSQSVTIKLATEDADSAIGAYLSTRYNYARVVYGDVTGSKFFAWYYFISSIEMIADGTLEVVLQLDALNSFRNWKGALTERTFVVRHLINRWDENGRPLSVYSAEDVGGEIVKSEEAEIAPSPCYLVYETTEGVPTLHCTDKSGIQFKNAVTVTNDYLADRISKWAASPEYAFTGSSSKKVTIHYRLNDSDAMQTYTLTSSDALYVGVRQSSYKNASAVTNYVINVWVRTGDSDYPSWQIKKSIGANPTALAFIEIIGSGFFQMCTCSSTPVIDTSGNISSVTPGSLSIVQTDPISSVDRTLNTMFKIVEIPFTPDLGPYGRFVWDLDSKYFEFDDIESQVTCSKGLNLENIIREKPASYASASEAMADDPKIWSGQFSYYKIVYDSYSTVIAMDNINAEATSFVLQWTASTAMSSSSIFQVIQKKGMLPLLPRNVKEDYPFLISSDRNNELPLYNSDWLNYLRVGYNYDKKSNALGIISSLASTIGSILSGVATVASGGALSAATVPTMVSMGTSAIHGWTSTASAINSQTAKETQLKNQSFSVASVNDLSLFKAYGNATAKVEWWEPREDFKAQLGALFFYKGYARGWQYKPSLDIRTDFDYIECVPSWSGTFIKQTPPQFISLLNERLGEGVTVIHDNDGAWDIAQEKGNIER